MDQYLTYKAEDYRNTVKALKVMQNIPFDNQRSREAQERERAILAAALEAARYAALRMENPPLTREHLKRRHGMAVYLERPEYSSGSAGSGDGRDETIVILGPEGTERVEWFHWIPGRYYRFPADGGDLRFSK